MRLESISQSWYWSLVAGVAKANQAKLNGSPLPHWRTGEDDAFGLLSVTAEPIGTMSQTVAD
jgi:hypothetical protein